MSLPAVVVLLHKEIRDSLKSRWLWLFAAAFGGLALAIGALGLTETGGAVYFSRTLAGLINLVLLLVPLMALSLGAQSIAGERERRTLPALLVQPIGRTDLLLGKFFGVAAAFGVALALGFGVAGIALAYAPMDPALYAALVALALLLGLDGLSLGLLCSVLARRTAVALGAALCAWFVLVLLADLGLMGTAVALRLSADSVFLLALANPLQVFKLAALLLIRPSLDVLGPAGLYGVRTFGPWLGPMLVSLLVLWAVLPLTLAGLLFSQQSEP